MQSAADMLLPLYYDGTSVLKNAGKLNYTYIPTLLLIIVQSSEVLLSFLESLTHQTYVYYSLCVRRYIGLKKQDTNSCH